MAFPCEAGAELDTSVDPAQFKQVMGAVCTPVSIVSTFDGRRPHGTTVSAFCSLSLVPPMVMLALDQLSDLLALLRRHPSPRFGIDVLSQGQDRIARAFAVKGATKFRDVAWSAQCGVPHIDGSSCWLVCEADQLIPAGDHVIVAARVIEVGGAFHAPLTYHQREFGTHSALPDARRAGRA
jgi:flavin reductase (DIM6/NTAB) family NADH-FMN oxidoreductase RutF